jgi:hypothetical protein
MLARLLCFFGLHGSKYKIKVQKLDGKTYMITTCHRCWKETEKEVK